MKLDPDKRHRSRNVVSLSLTLLDMVFFNIFILWEKSMDVDGRNLPYVQ